MMIFARAISFLSHPFFILLYSPYFLMEKFGSSDISSLKWILVSYFFLGLILAFVVACVEFGIFSDFDITKREQRPLFFLFAGLITSIYLLLLFIFNGPKALLIVIAAAILGIIAIDIINSRIKASVHVATLSAFMVSVGLIYKGPYLLLLFLIPVMGWSRVKTKKHTPLEATIGGVLGGALTIVIYIASQRFLV